MTVVAGNGGDTIAALESRVSLMRVLQAGVEGRALSGAELEYAQETERRTTLEIVAEKLRSEPVVQEIAKNLEELAERELRVTGSWSLVPDSQTAWVTTAVQYLESCGLKLPEAERPDPYWADDVAGGIVMSVKAILGTDDLHVRIESQYAGGKRNQPAGEE